MIDAAFGQRLIGRLRTKALIAEDGNLVERCALAVFNGSPASNHVIERAIKDDIVGSPRAKANCFEASCQEVAGRPKVVVIRSYRIR